MSYYFIKADDTELAEMDGAEILPNTSADARDESFKWPHNAIVLLFEKYEELVPIVNSGEISSKSMWQRISDYVNINGGYSTTNVQCQSKFSGLKRTFKSIHEHNRKDKTAPRIWTYYSKMKEILENTTLHSMENTETSANNVEVTVPASSSSDEALVEGTSRKRRKKMTISEALLKSRRVSEENRERRHKENMQMYLEGLEVFSDLFSKLIDKI